MPLNPGQAPVHCVTLEDQKKGGAMVSPLKILANSTRNRKYCTQNCPFSDACPMLPLSMSKEFEVKIKNGSCEVTKHPCKLKEAPPGVQRRIQNMFLNGEEGLLLEIKNALFVAGTNLGSDVKERLAYADALGRLHKTVYGEKSSFSSNEPLEITVRQVHKPDGVSGQEIKVIRQENAKKLMERRIIPDEPDDNDPESLMLSPTLDAILTTHKSDSDDIILYDMSESDE